MMNHKKTISKAWMLRAAVLGVALSGSLSGLHPSACRAQSLTAISTEIDCGKTGFCIPATATFQLVNTSSAVQTISSVTPDCGCTQADFPKKAIAPGDTVSIKLTYDARQLGHFFKQAAISSNGASQPLYLTMRGVVLPDLQDYVGNYPYRVGDLLIDKNSLEFDDVNKGDRPQQVIHMMNDGQSVMHPNIMHLPSYLSAEVTPKRLSPGHSGRITLTLNSNAIRSFGLTQSSVYVAQQLGETVRSDNELEVSAVLLPDLKELTAKQRSLAPKLELSSTSLDLGAFEGKKKKSGEITLTNNGFSDLNISSLQMFTMGLRVTLGKRQLRPGQSTKLKVTAVREELDKARSHPRVLMITNDPSHAKVIITISYQ